MLLNWKWGIQLSSYAALFYNLVGSGCTAALLRDLCWLGAARSIISISSCWRLFLYLKRIYSFFMQIEGRGNLIAPIHGVIRSSGNSKTFWHQTEGGLVPTRRWIAAFSHPRPRGGLALTQPCVPEALRAPGEGRAVPGLARRWRGTHGPGRRPQHRRAPHPLGKKLFIRIY